MRVLRRCMALGAVAALSAACSLLVSVDGLEDGAAAPGPDAGSDAEAGPAMTGDGGEASTPEASTVDGGTWCVTHVGDASFCEDFDTQGLVRLDGVGEQGGGTVKADTANASSPPVSMLSDLPPVGDAGSSGAFGIHRVPPMVELWASVDVRVEKTSTTGSQLQVMKLLQLDPTTAKDQNAWEVGIAVNGTSRKLNVFWYNHYTTDYLDVFQYPTPVALGAWTRVGLHLRLKGALDGAVDVDIDGTRVASDLRVPSLYAKAPFELFIGAVYTKVPHDGWTVRTDNVLFDAK